MMTERIFELAKQADLIQWDTLPSGARTPDYESVVKAKKFAELIVRECMELTKQCSTGKGIHDLFADEIIAEHFGVEE
jgi:hypothetical protein